MYKHILVPTDGSQLSLDATRKAISLARETGARITFLTVQPIVSIPVFGEGMMIPDENLQHFLRRAEEEAKQIVAAASKLATDEGVSNDGVTVVSDFPYKIIVETATSADCDLIFMASHGRRGLAGLLIGSETLKVLTHCKVPVLVYR